MERYLDSDEAKLEFSLLLASKITKSTPVIVCVGSDRVISDMIAPLTAEFLVKLYKVNAYVYGRLNNPIIASNLKSAFEYINANHSNSQVIVIDAGVGKFGEVGKVRLNSGGLIPAGAFGYNTQMYGDISIMPIVSTFGVSAKTFLSCAKFNEVYKLAKELAKCVNRAVKIAEAVAKASI